MALISSDMRAIIDRARLSFVVTVCADGSPSLLPRASVRVRDDKRLVFMNVASPGTMAGLRRDPRVEIDTVDGIRQRGCTASRAGQAS